VVPTLPKPTVYTVVVVRSVAGSVGTRVMLVDLSFNYGYYCQKLLSQNARNTCPSVARRPPSTLETSTGLLGEAGQERVEDLERSLHLVTGRVFR